MEVCRIVFCVDLLCLSGEESLFADSPFMYFYSVESLLADVSVDFGVFDPVSPRPNLKGIHIWIDSPLRS